MITRLRPLLKTTIALCLLLWNLSLFSQNTESEAVSDSTQVEMPTAIPTINVIQKIGESNEELKLVEKKITVSNDIKKIDSLFPIFQNSFEEQKAYTENFIKANPNKQKIDNLYSKWFNSKSKLQDWLSTINMHEERNSRLYEQVAFNEKTWELTFNKTQTENAPDELLSSILNIWNRTQEVQTKIVNENNEFLRLESKINSQIGEIDDIMNALLALKNSEVYDLFNLRHEPLWQTSFKSVPKNDIDKAESLATNTKDAFNYFKNNLNRLLVFFILALCVSWAILYLKKGFIKYEIDLHNKHLKVAKNVITNHTIASIVFITLVVGQFFFTDSPDLLSNAIILLILFFAGEIIKPSLNQKFKKVVYVVMFFYILDSAKTYVWFNSAIYRVYLLIEAALVLGALFYFTYPYLKTRKLPLNKLSVIVIRLTPLLSFLCLVSIVSNILGYTNLTDITLKICTKSGVITVMFYSILFIAQGISMGIIHRHYSVKAHVDVIKRTELENKLLHLIHVAIFVLWVIFFLGMIDQLRPLVEYLRDVLTEPYKVGNLNFTLGAIVSFILILLSSYIISRLIAFMINDGEGVLRILKLPKGVPSAISLVIRYFIIAFGFVLALSSLGIELSKFNLMAGALGVGIGFGLQTVVSNFISGLILVFERPILPGDTVEVNNLLGIVSRIGIRSSSIRTFDGAEVIVPNNNLIANDLINWTLSDSIKRVEIPIGTTYDADPNKIIEILNDIAMDYHEVLKTPPPQALFSDFGDSSLNFTLRFWVPYEIGLQAKSDVSIAIYNKFKEHDIEIPFPQRDVHIKDLPKSEKGTDKLID